MNTLGKMVAGVAGATFGLLAFGLSAVVMLVWSPIAWIMCKLMGIKSDDE